MEDKQSEDTERESSLLKLPQIVMSLIFDKLPRNDVMGFRLLSSEAQLLVSEYEDNLKRRLPQNFQLKFSSMPPSGSDLGGFEVFPYRNINLDFDLPPKPFLEFSTKVGGKIKKLEIMNFKIQMSDEEYSAFNNFSSIDSLSIGMLILHNVCDLNEDKDPIGQFRIPKDLFERLQSLHIRRSSNPYGIYILLSNCENLQNFRIGKMDCTHDCHQNTKQEELWRFILMYLTKRKENKICSPLVLNFEEAEITNKCGIISEFAKIVAEENIALEAFPCSRVMDILYQSDKLDAISPKIVSVRGINPMLSHQLLPCLSKLCLDEGNFLSTYNGSNFFEDADLEKTGPNFKDFTEESNCKYSTKGAKNWPALKSLEISIKHSEISEIRTRGNYIFSCEELKTFKYLLGTKWDSVQQLKLQFFHTSSASIFAPVNIVENFAAVTKITLEIPIYRSCDVASLFHLLASKTKLVYLNLVVNYGLTTHNLCVGDFEEASSLLGMTCLKHLILKIKTPDDDDDIHDSVLAGFNQVGQNQDIFSDVFAISSLTCLMLYECFPIRACGVKALMNGPVGHTLRKFKLTRCPNFFGDTEEELTAALENLERTCILNTNRNICEIAVDVVCDNCQ